MKKRDSTIKEAVPKAVKHSVEKYYYTYKSLEKYEKTGRKTPFLADNECIRSYFDKFKR
jgi:hypothetical protein